MVDDDNSFIDGDEICQLDEVKLLLLIVLLFAKAVAAVAVAVAVASMVNQL